MQVKVQVLAALHYRSERAPEQRDMFRPYKISSDVHTGWIHGRGMTLKNLNLLLVYSSKFPSLNPRNWMNRGGFFPKKREIQVSNSKALDFLNFRIIIKLLSKQSICLFSGPVGRGIYDMGVLGNMYSNWAPLS